MMYFDACDMATWRCMLFMRCNVFEKKIYACYLRFIENMTSIS